MSYFGVKKLFWKLFPQSLLLNGHLRHIQTRFITKNFINNLKDSPKSIQFEYDLSVSPSTYGDYINLVMLVRFISMSGYEVTLSIIRSNTRYKTHKISKNEELKLINDYIKIAKLYLPKNVDVIILRKRPENKGQIKFDSRVLFLHSPYILRLLIRKYKWLVPNKYILNSTKRETCSKSNGYIAWHVRKGKWDKERNNSADIVRTDFEILNQVFKNYDIMVFSTHTGLNFVFRTLANLDKPKKIKLGNVTLIPQINSGFPSALQLILSSRFYFQRAGGGLGMILYYSNVPYVIISPYSSYQFSRKGKKIAPFHFTNQYFLISKNYNKINVKYLFKKIKNII